MDNWDSWHVQHCSCAAASTTHSHPSHSGGNILINTENILSLSVCLYLCYSSTLFVYSPQRKDISLSVTVKSQLSWSPLTGSECVDCHLASSQSYHDPQVSLIANLLDMTSLDSQWMFFINKLNRVCWYFDIQHLSTPSWKCLIIASLLTPPSHVSSSQTMLLSVIMGNISPLAPCLSWTDWPCHSLYSPQMLTPAPTLTLTPPEPVAIKM